MEEKFEVNEETVVEASEQPMKKVGGLTRPMSPGLHSKVVDERLDKAIADAKQSNRSSDLVPLQLQFDKVKRQLKSAITAAKMYHAAMLNMDMARIKVCMYHVPCTLPIISIPTAPLIARSRTVSHELTSTCRF
jgi:hypothetical protein